MIPEFLHVPNHAEHHGRQVHDMLAHDRKVRDDMKVHGRMARGEMVHGRMACDRIFL